jgi:hypothetical protein
LKVCRWDHAQVQGAVENLFDQPRYRRGSFLQRIVVAGAGQHAPALAMTSSPTRLISSSSLSALTRT